VLAGSQEIVVVGDPADAATQALLAEVRDRFLPNAVVAGAASAEAARAAAEIIPLLANRGQIDGMPTAYVCQHFACRLPVTEAADLTRQLKIPSE